MTHAKSLALPGTNSRSGRGGGDAVTSAAAASCGPLHELPEKEEEGVDEVTAVTVAESNAGQEQQHLLLLSSQSFASKQQSPPHVLTPPTGIDCNSSWSDDLDGSTDEDDMSTAAQVCLVRRLHDNCSV